MSTRAFAPKPGDVVRAGGEEWIWRRLQNGREGWYSLRSTYRATGRTAAMATAIAEMQAEGDGLRLALVRLSQAVQRSNELLRSCYTVAVREGRSTNWQPLKEAIFRELNAQHQLSQEEKENGLPSGSQAHAESGGVL